MDGACEFYRWETYEAVDPVLPIPDAWGIVLCDTSRYAASRRFSDYALCLFGPGGLAIDIQPFPPDTPIEYMRVAVGSDDPPTHCWTIPTPYGAWEAMYTEGHETGTLELNIRLAPYAEELQVLPLDRGPAARVAELGACIMLPLTKWALREGWVDVTAASRAGQAVAESPAE
jgi:hypothetical protein